MTAAMINGSFADFKLVKTRSVAQLVVEVPIERADEALRMLGGVPQPGHEKPVAIARLRADAVPPPASAAPIQAKAGTPVQESPRAKQAWRDMKLAARAGVLCNDPKFWEWTGERAFHIGKKLESANDAADWLRHRTAVASRREYDTDEAAGRRYLSIEAAYLSSKLDAERYGT